MAHFLKACTLFEVNLPALYDTMYLLNNLRIEERDGLFTSTNIYLLKLLADLEKIFMKEYLRSPDTSDILASEVFTTSDSFATKVESMETPSADEFCDTLKFDQNGNLEGTLQIKGNNHNTILNRHSRQSRGRDQNLMLNDIKFKLTGLKKRLLENVTQNIKDQCDDGSWF